MLGIDDEHDKVALQQVVERLPELARALHDDMRNLQTGQPGRQGQQIRRHCAERAYLLAWLAIQPRVRQQTTNLKFGMTHVGYLSNWRVHAAWHFSCYIP